MAANMFADVDSLKEMIAQMDHRAHVTPYGIPMLVRDLYAFRQNVWLGDCCIDVAAKSVLNQHGPSVFYISPLILSLGKSERLKALWERQPFGEGIEKFVAIENVANNHLCAIGVDMKSKKRTLYDPLQQRLTHKFLASICKDTFTPLLRGIYAIQTEENYDNFK